MMQRPGHGQLALLSTAAAVTVGRQVVGKVRVSRSSFGRHALLASTSLSSGTNADIDTPAKPVTETTSSDCKTNGNDLEPTPQQSPTPADSGVDKVKRPSPLKPFVMIVGAMFIWIPGTAKLGAAYLLIGVAFWLEETLTSEFSELNSKLGKLQESVNTLIMDKAAREAEEKSKRSAWHRP